MLTRPAPSPTPSPRSHPTRDDVTASRPPTRLPPRPLRHLPDGHADDAGLRRVQSCCAPERPVFWVDTPGQCARSGCSAATVISRRWSAGAPFTAAPRTFLTSRMTEERLERMLGKPMSSVACCRMDEREHTAYRAVAQPSLTPGSARRNGAMAGRLGRPHRQPDRGPHRRIRLQQRKSRCRFRSAASCACSACRKPTTIRS